MKAALADIEKGKVAPVYLIYGDEDFLVRDALDRVINLLLPEGDSGLHLFYLDGENDLAERICEALLAPPLIPGRKVVVVRNTRLFHSRASTPQLIAKAVEDMDSDPLQTVKNFVSAMRMAGWALDDLRDSGWKKISDREWKKISDASEGDRAKWLPRMIELCDQYGVDPGTHGEKNEKELEAVLRRGIPENNCLVLTAASADRRKSLFKAVSETGIVLHFSRVKSEARQRDIAVEVSREILSKEGKGFAAGAFSALGRKTGFDPEKTISEVRKLVAFAGDKTYIDESDVEAVIEKSRENSVFSLASLIMEKKTGETLAVLRDLLDKGVHYLMILSVIIREMRLLLQARILIDAGKPASFDSGMPFDRFQRTVFTQITERSQSGGPEGDLGGLHPYVVYQLMKNCVRFSTKELISILDRLLETDIAMKTTGRDPQLLLERLVLDLCRA